MIFDAGDGRRFRKDMQYLIDMTRKVVPKIFMSEDYKDRQNRIVREFEGRQRKLVKGFEEKLTEAGFVMVQVQYGVGVRNEIHPIIDEEPMPLEQVEVMVSEGKFAASRLDELRRKWDSLRREFDVTTIESKKLTTKLEEAVARLDFSIVTPLITEKFNLLRKRYQNEKVHVYLDEAEEAMLSDLDRFRETQQVRSEEDGTKVRAREPFEEFSVNLMLDNTDTDSTPIEIEKSPSYRNLFGSLERVVDRFGYWRTDFTRIFAGSLLKASGGFLVVNATDVLSEQGAWSQLKRTLRNREIEIVGYDPFYQMAGAGIKPEPIPLDVKVVIIGDPWIYSTLWRVDEEFKKIFKIKAEFDSVMAFNERHVRQYYEFVRLIVEEENLLPFDLAGMQSVVEFGRRLSGDRSKLTTRFTAISDIIREASFCTAHRRGKVVGRKDVYKAMTSRRNRVNLSEEKIQELYDTETLMVSTTGKEVGQINGLSVYSSGEHSFGRPTRITCSTSLGKAGVINIERESDLSGPIHNKGVLVLSGYLRSLFAQDKPMVFSSSLTFEQSYGGVDGDSASSTEIYVILSSLANIPILQSLAVTGSVNQKGEIQPIGGVNEKVEGFFDVCKARRLTGSQGVIIPHQNVKDLLLRPDVIEAVKAKKFHIYPIKTIDQGIELLMGKPAGKRLSNGTFTDASVFAIVDDKLREMALALQNFGRIDNNDKNNNGTTSKSKSKRRTVKR